MTISSATPVELADRLQDKRERDAAKVEERWWNEARENVWKSWIQAEGRDVLNDALGEWTISKRYGATEALIDALEEAHDCDAGKFLREAWEKYRAEYLEDHRHLIAEECYRLEEDSHE